MARLTKKQKALSGLDRQKHYGIDEAIQVAKANATAQFDETIEIVLSLGVDPRHADQMVRGVTTLPAGTGKDVRVAAFAKGDKADEAKAAGADGVGAEDLMETIQGGTIDFDRGAGGARPVFAEGDKADEARAAGADVVGAEDLMETIQGGTIDFDRVIA